MNSHVDIDPRVRAVFDACPPPVRDHLHALRARLYEVADSLDGVGPIEESLRWGEPAYLTSATGTGTTIRLASKEPGDVGIYVHCQTDLVETVRARHPEAFRFEGTRGLHLRADVPLPEDAVRDVFALALTYRLRKRRR